ncbi:MAG: molecular chaperone HtpG, partial [Lentisphaerae bacterium]|nr:molecular chaperone HtpG [Lentisphaerota bacterium]
MAKKTKKFKTEVSELLNLVINSLYSKKEVFLRELISNASDAIDRARFSALTDGSQSQEEPYQITITPDKESKTLTISDNGIGMTHKEVEENIGTVASSGTKKFLEAMKETAGAPELIGQFGVGFYAAFMVADKVDLKTRKRGETAVMWSSDGTDSYQIGEIEEDVAPGTEITIHVRDDMPEFLESWTIRETVRRYSDYIEYPIVLMPDPSAEKDEDDEDEEKTGEEPQTLNSMKAIWKRSADEVSKDDLNNFYKHIAHDSADPLATIQVSVEGATEFTALLFIPSTAPYDMFFANAKQGLHLYARNVFIGDDIKELLPRYLSFVRGVVESSDLPLNVSREMLQDDGIIRRIRKVLISRIISKIQDMMKNQPEDFVKFNRQFGRMIKEGVHSDWENFDKLKELITFPSTLSDDESKIVTLKEYVERMPSSQKEIYYISADTFSSAKNSPLLEVLEQHGYEVLFFTEPVDAFVAERLREYDGKKLQAADRGELNLDDDKKEKDEDGKPKPTEADKKFKPLTDYIAERFKEDVKTVRISSRLTDSASCLVADEYGHTAHMERVMCAFNENMPKSLRIMELNPDHPV